MLQQIQTPNPPAGAEVIVNENFRAVEHVGVYAKRAPVTTGLTWGYYGGRWGGFSVADGTLTLTNTATNYVVVQRSDGAISVATTSTNWDDTDDYARVYKLTVAGGVVTAEEDHRAGTYGVHGGTPLPAAQLQTIPIACSDEDTPLIVGQKIKFHMPYAFTLMGDKVMAGLTTVQTSGSTFTVDINEAGASILSTKITIDNGEENSFTAAAAPVVSDSSLAKGAAITVEIDQVGDGTAAGLKVYLIGVPA